MLSSLEQRVFLINRCNQERLKNLLNIEQPLKALEGVKVELATGGRTKKFNIDNIPTIKEEVNVKGVKCFLSVQSWVTFQHGHVILNTKLCLNGGSYDNNTAFCQYYEKNDWIARVTDQHLTDSDGINTNIEGAKAEAHKILTVEEFEKKKAEYIKQKNILENIKTSINYNLRDFLPRH